MKKISLLLSALFIALSSFGQSADGLFKTVTASGTNSYTISDPQPNSTAYDAKEKWLVTFTLASTGSVTLNRNGIGAKIVRDSEGTQLASGDILAGQRLLLSYNGTYYQVVGGSGGGGDWGEIGGTLSAQTDLQSALDAKQASLVSGTNIKTVESTTILGSGNIDITATNVGLGSVDNTSDVNKPVSTAQQALIQQTITNGVTTSAPSQDAVFDADALKANLANPTFTGTVTVPTPFTVGATSVTSTGTQLNYLNAATGTTGTTSTSVVFSASPTFTGIPAAPTASQADNSTQLATTAYVDTGLGGKLATGLAYLLASGGTATAANTFTNTVQNGWIFNNTFTATNTASYGFGIGGTYTARATAADNLLGFRFSPTLVAAANTQVLNAFDLNPTFTNGAFTGLTNYAFRVRNAGVEKFSITGSGFMTITETDATATNRGFSLSTRNVSLTFPVPVLRPTTTNSVIAFDLMPNGAGVAEVANNGFSWFDVCTADVLTTNTPQLNTARVGARSDKIEFGARIFNTGNGLPLVFTQQATSATTHFVAQTIATTGAVTFTPAIQTTGTLTGLTYTGPAHTGLTASTEAPDVNFNFARTVQFATGAITSQRSMRIQASTYGFVGASTITDAATVSISGPPVAGTNATITRNHAFWVESGISRFDGGIKGSTTNDAATAGNIGEEVISTISTYANYSTTATYQAVTSITLTAGDWDLRAFFTYSANSATITAASNSIFVISTTSASAAGATEGLNIAYVPQAALLGTSRFSDGIIPYRVSLSGSTTYYLNTQATFTLGNPQYVGTISARRIR